MPHPCIIETPLFDQVLRIASAQGAPPTPAILNEDRSVLLADLVNQNQTYVVAKGGKGGLGNSHFKSSTNQAPRKFTIGEKEEEKWIWLSLKIFADIGIIGKPNAGKSTLLSKISAAQPKIADYPFTTLYPNLGVVKKFDQEIVVADIPGLIEGAHEGKGIGDRFLAHIERCKFLLHIIDISDINFLENYKIIREELVKYGKNLNQKKEFIALSKSDLLDISKKEVFDLVEKELGKKPYIFSSISNEGIDDLLSALFEHIETHDD